MEKDFNIDEFLEENKKKHEKYFARYVRICKENGLTDDDIFGLTEEDVLEWQDI